MENNEFLSQYFLRRTCMYLYSILKLGSSPFQICFYFFYRFSVSYGYLKLADRYDFQKLNFEKKTG